MSGIRVKLEQDLGFNKIRFQPGSNTVALKNFGEISNVKLVNLQDVDASNKVAGNILIYDANSDIFVLESSPSAPTDLDGGTF